MLARVGGGCAQRRVGGGSGGGGSSSTTTTTTTSNTCSERGRGTAPAGKPDPGPQGKATDEPDLSTVQVKQNSAETSCEVPVPLPASASLTLEQ